MPRIASLLIANRGEIACRVARSCRAMGISPVTVFSDADRDALHLRACDAALCIGGDSASASYLRGDLLIAAARRLGADALHPGYGFLSENAAFARSVQDAGLTWIGPGPDAIAAMGAKVRSRELAVAAGVPVVPGSHDPAQWESIGFPLLVKADAGGGGRGMRLVRRVEDLAQAVASARQEAQSAFGDDRVFLERFVERARHIEVQVFGDSHGNVVHLGERDCSTQRRHQKVIEESPSPVLDDATRARMGEAAVRLAKAVGYVNAGTVEMLYDVDRGDFFFLEMNTRLQVEHPVTEQVRGVDLVRWQLLVAMGERLPPVPKAQGAAMEARLYAEDPSRDYLPGAGKILDFWLPPLEGVRVDAGVETGGAVSVHYDPMIAKIIATGEDREAARRRLCYALSRLSVMGLATNKAQLLWILRHPDFISGAVHTNWLAQIPFTPSAPDLRLARIAALSRELLSAPKPPPGVPLNWRNNRWRDAELGIEREALRWRTQGDSFAVTVGGETTSLLIRGEEGAALRLRDGDLEREVRVLDTGDGWWVNTGEHDRFLRRDPVFPEKEELQTPGACVAPVPGKVTRVAVYAGQRVAAGELLVVMEAMKMEHHLRAAVDGQVVAVRAAVGEQVEAGKLIVEVAKDAPYSGSTVTITKRAGS